MKYIGLDYGSKTVGVALTDETGTIARSVEIVRRENEKRLRRTCARIESIIVENHVDEIVIGLPLNMDGSEGERAEKAREFAEMLGRRTGMVVHMVDERLTTVEADEIMDANAIKDRRERKSKVDSIAAAVILQDFINEKAKG
ncbi:MAG: Holliday junction resolvase RuvX [Lachnospiraceae bacterium]|nr:Holliday junction resolvase RuvX [Lachnospiraceae bacterium]MCR5776831.1 Holliday junction resolvase RuvX [Lachnospiraceae bacterium]